MPLKDIAKKYEELKKEFPRSPLSSSVTEIIYDLFLLTTNYLSRLPIKALTSSVIKFQNDKALPIEFNSYFSFEIENKVSRAVNSDLFCDDYVQIRDFIEKVNNNKVCEISAHDITKICYTIAITFCCSIDLLKSRDQKTPGTYFEYFIGHLYAKHFNIKPKSHLDVLNLDMKAKLPTDFIFDLGQDKPKYHVPVKTSTRERVVQVWAHQRVLDGVYGTGQFKGLLTCLAETKLSHKTYDVVEICLPDQWKIYQRFIARLDRVYYLDLPTLYRPLNSGFPKIDVKEFGDFFHESSLL